MKKIIKITSAFLTAAVLMISVSAAPFHALTLYVDGMKKVVETTSNADVKARAQKLLN